MCRSAPASSKWVHGNPKNRCDDWLLSSIVETGCSRSRSLLTIHRRRLHVIHEVPEYKSASGLGGGPDPSASCVAIYCKGRLFTLGERRRFRGGAHFLLEQQWNKEQCKVFIPLWLR